MDQQIQLSRFGFSCDYRIDSVNQKSVNFVIFATVRNQTRLISKKLRLHPYPIWLMNRLELSPKMILWRIGRNMNWLNCTKLVQPELIQPEPGWPDPFDRALTRPQVSLTRLEQPVDPNRLYERAKQSCEIEITLLGAWVAQAATC